MTMKIIILVVISLGTIYSESTDIRLVSFYTKIDKLTSIYLNKCVRNLDLTQQKIAYTAFIKCLRIAILFESDFCSNYDGTCLQNFTKVTKGCLDTNEKYFPDFMVHAEQRFLNRFCKGNESDHLTKILINKCELPVNDIIGSCVLTLNIFNNLDSKDYSFNRIDLCSDLKTLQKCYIKIYQAHCGIAKEGIDLLNSIFEEYQKECSLANTNMSNFVVLALLVIISKLSQ